MRICLFLILFSSFCISQVSKAESTWFDQSHEVLLPKNVSNKLIGYQEFPLFWWNFLVYEFPKDKPIPWAELRQVCQEILHKKPEAGNGKGDLLRRSPCENLDGALQNILADWSRDYFLRHPKPSDKEVQGFFNQSLAKASLPMGPTLLNLLRQDPFNSLEEYKDKVLGRVGLNFENHQGLFYDAGFHRVLIPVQFTAMPSETKNVAEVNQAAKDLCKTLGCKYLAGVGPHFSTWENETRIRADVSVVEKVGWVVLFIFVAFFVITKRWKLLFLFPPLMLSMGTAGFLTYLIFGKIHGLTLSFGPSIVGMAIDYGLQGAFSKNGEKGIWRSNLFGLLTTLGVFIVMLFSELPIINQIAVFSILGLTIGFFLFLGMKKFFPQFYHVEPFQIPEQSRVMRGLSLILVVSGLLTPFLLRPDLSLRQLNYEDKSTVEIRNWVYTAGKSAPPLIDIVERKDVATASAEQLRWGTAEKLQLTNAAVFLPPVKEQIENLKTWDSLLCAPGKISSDVKEFFAPFWKQAVCGETLSIQNLAGLSDVPSYMRDLYSKEKWVTLWFPKTEGETEKIHSQYPNSESFVKVMSLFSETLGNELQWIVPTALLLAFALLFFHSQSLLNSLLCIVPFFSGMGLFFLVATIFKFPLSFITVIGLIMVFGFSIDFGIFMVNLITKNQYEDGHGVKTSITLASLSTVMGFSPLVFALHPAMHHLGQALFFGAIGAHIGAVWGIPTIYFFKANLRIKTLAKRTALVLLFAATTLVWVYHKGVFPHPAVPSEVNLQAGRWLPKTEARINQLVLQGNPYERGLAAGKFTAPLLKRQEEDLFAQLEKWVPSRLLLRGMVIAGIAWFQGADKYFEPWALQEMYGVSESAPKEFDFMTDGYTRQVAYHGLHEVGQLLVDQGFEGMGCTVGAVPWKKSWVLGRNFDFEGGRIFDDEKIIKWVFPDQGHAFVSVIWAGMVGVVTGVNDQGLYISLNAAGTNDFRRLGTPSTLLVAKALQEASTAEEALEIFKNTQMFISDIFVLVDSKRGLAFRIEKSPEATEVIQFTGPHLVTNHFISPRWANDSTNLFRRDGLTSKHREVRGQKLVDAVAEKHLQSDRDVELEILKIIRDKGEVHGQSLHLGNRAAIDALIAAHAVIFNGNTNTLFVGTGPALSGVFLGYDLTQSFQQKKPIQVSELPADPLVPLETFQLVKQANSMLAQAHRLIRKEKCDSAKEFLNSASNLFSEQSFYYEVLGELKECLHQNSEAKAAYQKALDLHPPYIKTETKLKEKVQKL